MKNKNYILVLFIIVLGTLFAQQAQCAPNTEYKLKAAYIYNFIKFVNWPKAEDAESNIIKIGVIGKSPFGNHLDLMTQKTVRNRKLKLVNFDNFDTIKDKERMLSCDVIFICKSENKNSEKILRAIKSSNVLAISDNENFAELGGTIGFKNKDNKIRFEINLNSAKAAKLKISSQLLKLALRVIEKKTVSLNQ